MAGEDYTLCVLGWYSLLHSSFLQFSGTMGVAIISGILESIIHPGSTSASSSSGTSTPIPIANITHRMPNKFAACVKRDESARNLRHIFDHNLVNVLSRKNVQGARSADLILLGAKPNMCKEILTEEGMKEALDGKLLISIATGVTIAQLREWCPENTHIVRAMPNVPCKVRALSGCWYANGLD
jgi:pyrroline-5-carboxylate reductase